MNLSTWSESVSAQAKRRGLPIEHFTGYSKAASGRSVVSANSRSIVVLAPADRLSWVDHETD